MAPLSPTFDESASNRLAKGLQLVATALAARLETLASAVGKDVSQACKVRSGDLGAKLDEVVAMLYAAGLKVVPVDRVCVRKDKYEAMVVFASAAMSDVETARRLTWEE
jgi:hypothetical protein